MSYSRQALLQLHVNDQLVINCNDSRRPCLMLVIVNCYVTHTYTV